jgi:hypothetical protein
MIRTPTRAILLWAALALAGVVVAVGVSFAASQLSKPRIGLASEPITAGAELTPRPKTTRTHRTRRHKLPPRTTTSTVRTTPDTTPVATTPVGTTPVVTSAPARTGTTRARTKPPNKGDDSGGGADDAGRRSSRADD